MGHDMLPYERSEVTYMVVVLTERVAVTLMRGSGRNEYLK